MTFVRWYLLLCVFVNTSLCDMGFIKWGCRGNCIRREREEVCDMKQMKESRALLYNGGRQNCAPYPCKYLKESVINVNESHFLFFALFQHVHCRSPNLPNFTPTRQCHSLGFVVQASMFAECFFPARSRFETSRISNDPPTRKHGIDGLYWQIMRENGLRN